MMKNSKDLTNMWAALRVAKSVGNVNFDFRKVTDIDVVTAAGGGWLSDVTPGEVTTHIEIRSKYNGHHRWSQLDEPLYDIINEILELENKLTRDIDGFHYYDIKVVEQQWTAGASLPRFINSLKFGSQMPPRYEEWRAIDQGNLLIYTNVETYPVVIVPMAYVRVEYKIIKRYDGWPVTQDLGSIGG